MLYRFLKLYPKGDSRADGKCLSIFLCLADCDKPKPDEKIFVQANFRVLDPRGSNHFQRQCIIQNYSYIIIFSIFLLTKQQFCRLRFFSLLAVNYWYNEQHLGGGWIQFLSLPELRKVYFDKEDTLKVEIEFKAVSATKYSPII